ncbi:MULTISPECIES: hypothetical protein [unclassified Streptomyces]|uniref:hypothetical protein n=1 Tax=unclassified Streptomyces TaxID=2593676 RepID=UPI0035E2614E
MASIWYLALVTLLGVPQAWLERRYGRGTTRAGHVSPFRRLLGGTTKRIGKNSKEQNR